MTETADATSADLEEHHWKDRRLLSWSIRVVAVAIPLLGAAGVTMLHFLALDRPTALPARLLFWGGVVLGSIAVALFLERWTRRLLPLAVLLRMSLAFPGEAPNRLVVAFRERDAKRLEAQLVDGDISAEASAAQKLVSLVGLLRHHDHKTRGHAERVCAYAELTGRELGLDEADIDKLKWAALIHDVGKLSVPPHVLNSDEPPSDDDRQLIRNHPVSATAYLGVVSGWLGEWAHAALEHHERWDGEGYPAGLTGEEIGLAGRIVAVVDAYDVMTSATSYRVACTVDEAREELARNSGSQFDPAVVRAFLQITPARLALMLGPVGWLNDRRWLPNIPLVQPVPVMMSTLAIGVAAATAVAVEPTVAIEPEAAVERIVEPDTSTTTTTTERPTVTTTVPATTTTTTSTTTTTTTTTTLAPLFEPAVVVEPTGSGFVLVDPESLDGHLGDGQYTSDDHAFVWFEPPATTQDAITVRSFTDGVPFAGDLQERTSIPADTSVCSAFVHADPDVSTELINVELDFGVAPLGLALRGEELDATGSFGVEGLDHRSDGLGADDLGLVDGTTIRFTMGYSVGGRDQVRIFLPC